MADSNTLDLYEKLKDINKMRADFWQRMALLATASTEGLEKRTQRMNSYCEEAISDELVNLSTGYNVADLNAASMELVEKCAGAGFEELRNAEQTVLLTQEELWYWAGLFLNAWFNVADSLSPKAVTH